jgi:hypothetical protein
MDGATVQEVFDAVQAADGTVLVEIYVRPLDEEQVPFVDGPVEVSFPGAEDLVELVDLEWNALHLEAYGDEWELSAVLQL